MKRMLQLSFFGLIAAAVCSGSVLAAGSESSVSTGSIFIILFFPALIALIVCSVMKGKMKSTGKKTSANTYISAHGIHVTGRMDRYTHTTETRRRIDNGTSQANKR